MIKYALVGVGLLLVLFSVFAQSGVCDESDVLKNSPECSPSMYVLTSTGGPLNAIYVSPEGNSFVLTYRVDNYSPSLYGVICVQGDGVEVYPSVCYVVPPSTTQWDSVKVVYSPEDVSFFPKTVGYVVFNMSHSSKRVPVVVVPDYYRFVYENLDVFVAAVLFLISVLVYIRYARY